MKIIIIYINNQIIHKSSDNKKDDETKEILDNNLISIEKK